MNSSTTTKNWLSRLSAIEKGERRAVLLSFAYFFALLCSYYIIRPVRDEMGVVGGVDKLQWLFTGTFVVMLLVMPVFGWVSSRFPRRQFLPWVYGFFIFNLLVFFALFQFTSVANDLLVARVFFFYTTLATFLYFQQAEIIRDSFSDSAQRTAVFAFIDMAVNSLTLLFQLMVTARIIRWLGLAKTLALIPLLLALGFAALGNWPVLGVLVTIQIIRRAGDYAIMRPAREILFVVLTPQEKYKAKNFIDTTIYRGGDAVSAWAYAGLGAIGLSLAQIAWLAVPLALVWAIIAYMLGIRQQQIAEAKI